MEKIDKKILFNKEKVKTVNNITNTTVNNSVGMRKEERELEGTTLLRVESAYINTMQVSSIQPCDHQLQINAFDFLLEAQCATESNDCEHEWCTCSTGSCNGGGAIMVGPHRGGVIIEGRHYGVTIDGHDKGIQLHGNTVQLNTRLFNNASIGYLDKDDIQTYPDGRYVENISSAGQLFDQGDRVAKNNDLETLRNELIQLNESIRKNMTINRTIYSELVIITPNLHDVNDSAAPTIFYSEMIPNFDINRVSSMSIIMTRNVSGSIQSGTFEIGHIRTNNEFHAMSTVAISHSASRIHRMQLAIRRRVDSVVMGVHFNAGNPNIVSNVWALNSDPYIVSDNEPRGMRLAITYDFPLDQETNSFDYVYELCKKNQQMLEEEELIDSEE